MLSQHSPLLKATWTVRGFKYLVEDKWNHPTPISFTDFHKEFVARTGCPKTQPSLNNCMKQKLKDWNSIDGFSFNEITHMNFLLSVPVTDAYKRELESRGTLRVDEADRIIYFRTHDGIFERKGVHKYWKGKKPSFQASFQSSPFLHEDNSQEDMQFEDEDIMEINTVFAPPTMAPPTIAPPPVAPPPVSPLSIPLPVFMAPLEPVREMKPTIFHGFIPEEPVFVAPPESKKEEPGTSSESGTMSAFSILSYVHNLAMVLESTVLNELIGEVRNEMSKPGQHEIKIPITDISSGIKQGLQTLLKSATSTMDPSTDSIGLAEFLKIFKLQLLNLGLETGGATMNKITEAQGSAGNNMVPMTKVRFLLDCLAQTATP